MRAVRVRDGVDLLELVVGPLEEQLAELEERTGEPFELPPEVSAAALAVEMRGARSSAALLGA